MIHEAKIKWHDLLENPKDTPPNGGNYLVTIFLQKCKIWRTGNAFWDPVEKIWTLFNDNIAEHWDVEAWSYGISPYLSAAWKKEEEK